MFKSSRDVLLFCIVFLNGRGNYLCERESNYIENFILGHSALLLV